MAFNVLVTGGAGFIGSHTCLDLLNAGYAVTVLDSYSNSDPESLNRVESFSEKTLTRIKADIRDIDAVKHALRICAAYGVIHFAGLKSVGQSVREPLL